MRASLTAALLLVALLALLAAGVARPTPALAATPADGLVPGTVLDAGAPVWSADPTSLLCALGCTPVSLTGAPGGQLEIICRNTFGYLQVVPAGRTGAVWLFAADVHAYGSPKAC